VCLGRLSMFVTADAVCIKVTQMVISLVSIGWGLLIEGWIVV
jgi:hypothetical protein